MRESWQGKPASFLFSIKGWPDDDEMMVFGGCLYTSMGPCMHHCPKLVSHNSPVTSMIQPCYIYANPSQTYPINEK